MNGFLAPLREQIAAHLQSRASQLGGATILTERHGDIEFMINDALAKIGAFIFVETPLPVETNPNVPDLCYRLIEVSLIVGAAPVTSPTGTPDAITIAESALLILRGWQPRGLTGCDALWPADRCIQSGHTPERPELNIYSIHLRTKGGTPATPAPIQ